MIFYFININDIPIVNILVIYKILNCYSIILLFYFKNCQVVLGHPLQHTVAFICGIAFRVILKLISVRSNLRYTLFYQRHFFVQQFSLNSTSNTNTLR